jgi:hypothetical protein
LIHGSDGNAVDWFARARRRTLVRVPEAEPPSRLQLSPRGGELHCMLEHGHVRVAGTCAHYMGGFIHI